MPGILDSIKKIKLVQKLAKLVKGNAKFKSTGDYWESRYAAGGNSGAGSYNALAEYKAEIINAYVKEKNIASVIEFGCGDGNQLRYFDFKSYLGFDISATVIANCRKKYAADSTKSFEVITNYTNQSAELTMSLDVIYHLVEYETFDAYMKTLFAASKKYVIVYSSNEDNHENNNVAAHVKHRKFTTWVEKNASQFKLTNFIKNKYPYNGVNEVSSYADFYFYEKN